RRGARGKQAEFPRFKGRNRYHSFRFKEHGNGARLEKGSLDLSKIGRIRVQWSRPLEGSKTSTVLKVADGWHVAISCDEVPGHSLPPPGGRTVLNLNQPPFPTLSNARMAQRSMNCATIERRRPLWARANAGSPEARGKPPAARRWAIPGRKPANTSATSGT